METVGTLPSLDAELAIVESVEGWLARDEARLLIELASGVASNEVVLEVGNYRGRSTTALALGARRSGSRVYSVDPHRPFQGARGGRFGPPDQAALYANLARAGVGELVHVVGLGSTAVAKGWDEAPIGVLFVDGDHRYAAVAADFAAWEPHLARGARVAFDDADFADVARLVAELVVAERLVVERTIGKVVLARRP